MILTQEDIIYAQKVWKNKKVYIYFEDEIYYMVPQDLYKFRKIKRHKRNALPGAIARDYNSRIHGRRKSRAGKLYPNEFFEEGAKKWEALFKILKTEGWTDSCPVRLMFSNRNNKAKIIDGHHRIPIAIELGIKFVPITFKYVWKKND